MRRTGLARGQERLASDIIHAEGVRGGGPPSTPKACGLGFHHPRRRRVARGKPDPRSTCRAARKTLLPVRQGVTRLAWCWVTFGEQSRVISRERRSAGRGNSGSLLCTRILTARHSVLRIGVWSQRRENAHLSPPSTTGETRHCAPTSRHGTNWDIS